ncbi:hypothetical protein SGGMMB4_02165 [Sodalis glossinidius str. 'morsitans']|uniref:DUF418 domain-containing protein n=1 Tax=Sodalis glossinidius (strain morsitans) TaxID=343509 RepID=Q2NUE2_SODGM|nr:DUF418 domain-containing protein YeiB [Sodalis glossinidius]BAE74233.1 conserved hypothetical protein [Sodalis glossinidius str. 'morsitans']CRL44817.1 hypothetical protein SGGMMB4_02165 [Sodalis glossinidius str. 'morsitans']
MRQRIAMLDCARGIAILGILLMNITAFGLPKAAYLNPAYTGSISNGEAWTWAVLDMVAQVKFLTLFALLFGGGLVLLLPRGTRWTYSRLLWLMGFGVIHGIFFWDGDILLDYGLVGLLCLGLIRQAPSERSLIGTGIVLYALGVGLLLVFQLLLGDQPPGRFWLPDIANRVYEHYWQTEGGPEAWRERLNLLHGSLLVMASQYGWQLAGAMLIGAGLMRNGWLAGRREPEHYRRMALWLIPAGLIINLPAVVAQWQLGWDYRWCGFLLQMPREISAPLQALGCVALLYGFWPRLADKKVFRLLGNVGRMALTNYLLQTLICTLLFNQLGLFMAYDRLQLMAFVPAVWFINIAVSALWFRYFRQGPLEAVWRRLTRLTGSLTPADAS